MSSWEQIKEIKGLLASLVAGFTVVSMVGLALMDWRVAVHVRSWHRLKDRRHGYQHCQQQAHW